MYVPTCYGTMYTYKQNLGELLEDGVPFGIGEAAGGQLDEGDAQRPHVRPHVIATCTLRV